MADRATWRDSRITLHRQACPACNSAPRWIDGDVFGCYACSATSSSCDTKLLPTTRRERDLR